MKLNLKKIVAPGFPLAILLLIAGYILWIVFYISGFSHPLVRENTALPALFKIVAFKNNLLLHIFNLALTILNSVLIFQLNNKFTIIRARTFLPVFIFNFLIGVFYETHVLFGAHLALTLTIISFFMFFEMFRNSDASEHAFLGTLFITLGSLFAKPLIFVIPLCWLGFVQFKSFSLRTFLASVFGMLLPWIFYFAISYYFHPDWLWINKLLHGFNIEFTISQRPLNEIIYLAAMILLVFVALGGLYPNMHNDSIQTRAKLVFLSYILFGVFALSMIFSHSYFTFTPFLAMAISLLMSHPLTLRQGNFYSIIFIIFVVVNLAFVVSNLINHPI